MALADIGVAAGLARRRKPRQASGFKDRRDALYGWRDDGQAGFAMTAETGADSALELAARRLERAVALLEQRVAQKITEASAGAGTAFDEDRARLAADLDRARGRERELEEAGAAASEALAAAIAQIKAALATAEDS
jgi:hypothetical protein